MVVITRLWQNNHGCLVFYKKNLIRILFFSNEVVTIFILFNQKNYGIASRSFASRCLWFQVLSKNL